MRKLILKNFQSPGDIIMLTAAVRDLHRSHPGSFVTDVRTPCPALWQHNPLVTPLKEGDPEVEVIECHYPSTPPTPERRVQERHKVACHAGCKRCVLRRATLSGCGSGGIGESSLSRSLYGRAAVSLMWQPSGGRCGGPLVGPGRHPAPAVLRYSAGLGVAQRWGL